MDLSISIHNRAHETVHITKRLQLYHVNKSFLLKSPQKTYANTLPYLQNILTEFIARILIFSYLNLEANLEHDYREQSSKVAHYR